MRSRRGVIPVVYLVVIGLIAASQAVPDFRITNLFAKDKVKSADLALKKAQDDLVKAEADAKASQIALEAARKAEREKQVSQVAYSQEMAQGASEALRNATPEPPVKLAMSLLERTNTGLAAAIGSLPLDKQAEIVKIVSDSLSGVQARLDEANAQLAAKDKSLAVTTSERDTLKSQIPILQTQVEAKDKIVLQKTSEVAQKTQAIVAVAQNLQAEIKKSGSLESFGDNCLRFIVLAGILYLIGHFALPSLAAEFPAVRLLQGANRTITSLISSHEIIDQTQPPKI